MNDNVDDDAKVGRFSARFAYHDSPEVLERVERAAVALAGVGESFGIWGMTQIERRSFAAVLDTLRRGGDTSMRAEYVAEIVGSFEHTRRARLAHWRQLAVGVAQRPIGTTRSILTVRAARSVAAKGREIAQRFAEMRAQGLQRRPRGGTRSLKNGRTWRVGALDAFLGGFSGGAHAHGVSGETRPSGPRLTPRLET